MNNWSIAELTNQIYTILLRQIRLYSKDFLQVSSQYVNQREPHDLINEIIFSLNQTKQHFPQCYKDILSERLFLSSDTIDNNNKLAHSIRLLYIKQLIDLCKYDDNYIIIHERFNSLIEWYRTEDLFSISL